MDPFYNPGVSGRLEPDREICQKENCQICENLRNTKFYSYQTNKCYKSPHNLQCITQNVIYLLTCNICKKQYVGETKRSFIIRLKEHLADIRHKRDKPLSNHIKSHTESSGHITFHIIECIHKDPILPETTEFRKKREIFWIYRLKTLHPHGLNTLGWSVDKRIELPIGKNSKCSFFISPVY